MPDSTFFSVVVPIFNEAGNIARLDGEIKAVLMAQPESWEVIYVNDGSTDQSLRELKSLREVTILDLNRNYGQATALDAGFKAAQGEYVISLDGDGHGHVNGPNVTPHFPNFFSNFGSFFGHHG